MYIVELLAEKQGSQHEAGGNPGAFHVHSSSKPKSDIKWDQIDVPSFVGAKLSQFVDRLNRRHINLDELSIKNLTLGISKIGGIKNEINKYNPNSNEI